jgi:hypothetical protein
VKSSPLSALRTHRAFPDAVAIAAAGSDPGSEEVHRQLTPMLPSTHNQRPGLDALLKDASRRKFDVVMAWAIDRLGRSLVDLLGTIQHLEASTSTSTSNRSIPLSRRANCCSR